MNPWRKVCETGLRQIKDSCRIGTTMYVAGERKGLIGDPILTHLGTPVADGNALYSFDLTSAIGGAASAVAAVTSDEIAVLYHLGDVLYAGGHTDDKGDLWVLHDGTWAGGSLWVEDTTEIGCIRSILFWSNALWVLDDTSMWCITTDGTVSRVTALESVISAGGDIVAAWAVRDDLHRGETTTWTARHKTSSGWSDSQEVAQAEDPIGVVPSGKLARVLGETHLAYAVDMNPAESDYEDWDSRGLYWPWELTDDKRTIRHGNWFEIDYQPKTTALLQEDLCYGLSIRRVVMQGDCDERTGSPLLPTVGMALAPGVARSHGERLHVAEGIPLGGGVNARIHIWPWAESTREIEPPTTGILPTVTGSFDAPYFGGFGTDGKPIYTQAHISTQSQTNHITSLSRTSGKLYAGLVNRLCQDIIPIDMLLNIQEYKHGIETGANIVGYSWGWDGIGSGFYPKTLIKSLLDTYLGDASGLYTYAHFPMASCQGQWHQEHSLQPWASIPESPYLDFTATYRDPIDYGGTPPHPTVIFLTDDTKAWLYQVSSFAFRRLFLHGSLWVAASATDGWTFGWEPGGRLSEVSDHESEILCAASIGGVLYLGMDGEVSYGAGPLGPWATDTFSSRGVEAVAEHGSAPWLALVGATDTEIRYLDTGTWTLANTLSGAYTVLCEHGTTLYAFGTGGAYHFDAGHPTGAAVTVTGLGGTEAVLCAYSDGTDMWIGTDAGKVFKLSGGTWAAVTVTGMPAGADVTSLRYWQARLWIGLTTTYGSVLDLADVTMPAGGAIYAVGDEGDRTVLALTEGTGAVETFSLIEDQPAIAMLDTYDTSGATVWFSRVTVARQQSTRMIWASGEYGGGGRWMDDRLAAFHSTSYQGATISALFPWLTVDGDPVVVLPVWSNGYGNLGGDLVIDANDYWDAVDAEDAAMGREASMALPCPAVATHVMLTSPQLPATADLWVTTDETSYDLADYQPVTPGILTALNRSGCYLRCAARMTSGTSTQGVAMHIRTETV